jgi:DNA-binding NtrC family response regulator
MVGESPIAWEVRRRVGLVAPLSGHVLVAGASGTGKELVARAIHAHSSRGRKSLVSRNAATLPETLVDAELFGNMKNYPNPGMPDRPGLVGQADGSTLFLDEIGELPKGAQAHLLRLLDSGEYQRLGESQTRHADVRIVCATNRPEQLRHDFGPRFSLRIDLPDLNSRREDIPLVARHLLRDMAEQNPEVLRRFMATESPASPRLTVDFARELVIHEYTTNVRELGGFLWQSAQESRGANLELPVTLARDQQFGSSLEPNVGTPSASSQHVQVGGRSVDLAEVQIRLDEHAGAIEPTWRVLGLTSRHALARLVKKYGLRIRR